MEKKINSAEKKIRQDYEEAVKKAKKWNLKLERAKEKDELNRKEFDREIEKKYKEYEKKRSTTIKNK